MEKMYPAYHNELHLKISVLKGEENHFIAITPTCFLIWRCSTFKSNMSQIDLFKIRGAYDKFPDFFRMGTFIDSMHMKP